MGLEQQCALRSRTTHCRGFTAVEMLIVLALAGVLALYAIPSLQATMAANRADTLANQLLASLSLARSEAVKLGQNVYVISAAATPGSAAGNTNWSAGWCVVTANVACSATSAPVVQGGAPVAPPTTVYANQPQIVFDATGRVAAPATEVDFIVCTDPSSTAFPGAQGVTVLTSGRARVAYHAANGGAPQVNSGTAMAACTGP